VLAAVVALVVVLAQETTDRMYTDPGVAAGSALVGALVGAIIGSTRNRTLLGAVLGLFCGCIGWIIILVAFPKRPRY